MIKRFHWLIVFLLIAGISAFAQNQAGMDSTGLPGDHFSLQGALQMFKQAGSPEEFERLINSEEKNINNLDLNGDGQIDYVKVIDRTDKDIHAFVLQVPVSENESQDIAVIELEKTGDASAIIQIIGDEEIYGEELIVEPATDKDADSAFDYLPGNGLAHGPSPSLHNTDSRITINVWFWPTVRFVYGPRYRPWISPWRWRHYPAWWRPWRPLAWRAWHPRHHHFHRPFIITKTHRVGRVHAFYRPFRVSSATVRTRHATAIGHYKVSRTRTTVTGPRGNTYIKKSTTVQGPRGGKAKRTTIRKRHR